MAQGEKLGIFHPERLKWFRNVNIFGALALAGAGVAVPVHQEALFLGAGINTVQAGGAEIIRQRKQKAPATT